MTSKKPYKDALTHPIFEYITIASAKLKLDSYVIEDLYATIF